jgi:DNA mismatch repair ATPase MutL
MVTVRNLFRNVPVRLQLARKQRVSLAKLKSLIMTYALVREVRFVLQLRGNRRVDWTVPATSDTLGVATSVCGKEVLQKYKCVSWSGQGITIEGIVPNVNEGASIKDY